MADFIRKKIVELPKQLADKIAAGEVVERPLSIVKELVENSIDAGSDFITVEIKNGGKSYIRVTDNGPGVPSDLMEDIFVPFFTTKATGSGIGLSLSRQIIRMHGGELSVASQPYRETCFTVSLPIKS